MDIAQNQTGSSLPRRNSVTSITGACAAVLGLVVIVGWHTQIIPLIGGRSTAAAPMAYNAAVAFLLCGVGFLMITNGRLGLARACGGAATLLGLVTSSQHVFGVDLGIDQALMNDSMSAAAIQPGRMAFSSALNFTLTGVAIFLMSGGVRIRQRLLCIGILGTIVLMLVLVPLILFSIGLEVPSAWGDIPRPMSIPTAVGFIVLGGGIMGWIRGKSRATPLGAHRWLPVLIGVSIATATLLLWQSLLTRTHRDHELHIQLAVTRLTNQITAELDTRLLALIRLSLRWERYRHTAQEEWVNALSPYLRDLSGLQAICWIDPSLQISWAWPVVGDTMNLNFDAVSEERRRQALETAQRRQGVTISRVIDLPQGGEGFFAAVPLFGGEHLSGFISGIFQAQTLFHTILKGVAPGYALRILDGTEELYQRDEHGVQYEEAEGQEAVLELYGATWRLRVWPGSEVLFSEHSTLPTVVLGAGLALAVLVAVTVTFAQTARARTRQTEAANRELKREIVARQQMEERYRLLTESLSDALYLVDRDGRITFCTPPLEQLTEYTLAELLGRPAVDLYDPSGASAFLERHQRAFAGEPVPPSFETDIVRKDGRHLPVELTVSNFVVDGRIVGRVAVVRDITVRKQAEATIRQLNADLEQRVRERTAELLQTNTELVRANTDLRQFASVAAHDLQEPLRMVVTNTQLLARRHQEILDGDADEYVRYAVEGAKRMQRLILDLLAYSEIDATQRAFTLVNCEDTLAGAIADLRGSISEREAIVTNDPLPAVWGDGVQLRTVFRNLISNGIKFRNEEPPHVHIWAEHYNDREWLFSVRDNGKGIASEYAERLFVVFERLHHQEQYPKPGVGLAICRKIIERHGGRIWVESTLGKGATFRFTLPTNPNPA